VLSSFYDLGVFEEENPPNKNVIKKGCDVRDIKMLTIRERRLS
jgi:hypothetical protein